jgi:hypothetical protein
VSTHTSRSASTRSTSPAAIRLKPLAANAVAATTKLEADPDDVSVNDRRHARMDKHNNKVGYDYIMAVSKRENHNDRFYCNMLRRKAARAKKTRFGRDSALPGFVASDRLMFWLHKVRVLPYDHDFGDGKRPCGES